VQSFSGGVDHKQILQSVSVDGQAAASPALQYAPFMLSYRGVWPAEQPQASTLDLSAILGLRGYGGSSDAAFNAKRAGASANFTALRASLQMARALGSWTLASKLELQLASGPLLPSEQFVAGGAESVRGFLEGERSGDGAARFSFELSSPALLAGRLPPGWRLSALAFADEAWLRSLQSGAGQFDQTSLAGAGLGLRLTAPHGLSLQIDAARALTDGDLAGGGTARGDWRLHGRLSMEF
jgi:hemolysin activation/secretion protein